ncbi:MAG: hypothetical protein IKS41_03585 [Alphaproteobacteria bacterium]|nr:hypothetical protein [Alphaproteobacteria bacterium]
MKKIAILGLFIALCPSVSFGQAVYSLTDILDVRESDIIYDKNYNPITGTILYNESDQLKSVSTRVFALPGTNSWSVCHKMELSVKNGKKDGKMKCYDREDILEKEYDFKDGYLNGMVIEYDKYHPGEISQKTEYKMNRCVKSTYYRDGRPYSGYRSKIDPTQKRISKVTGLPITELPARKVESCYENNSIREQYDYKGNLSFSEDQTTNTKTYYASNNRIYLYIEPVPEEFKEQANYIYTVYYENNKPMLRLTIKGDKAIAGEFYSENGEKSILDEQKATDYLMDIALSISLGAR